MGRPKGKSYKYSTKVCVHGKEWKNRRPICCPPPATQKGVYGKDPAYNTPGKVAGITPGVVKPPPGALPPKPGEGGAGKPPPKGKFSFPSPASVQKKGLPGATGPMPGLPGGEATPPAPGVPPQAGIAIDAESWALMIKGLSQTLNVLTKSEDFLLAGEAYAEPRHTFGEAMSRVLPVASPWTVVILMSVIWFGIPLYKNRDKVMPGIMKKITAFKDKLGIKDKGEKKDVKKD